MEEIKKILLDIYKMIEETNRYIWNNITDEDEEEEFQKKLPTWHSVVDQEFKIKIKSLGGLNLE